MAVTATPINTSGGSSAWAGSGSVDIVVWARSLGASTADELADTVGGMCSRCAEAVEVVDSLNAQTADVPDDAITEAIDRAARAIEDASALLQAAHRRVIA